ADADRAVSSTLAAMDLVGDIDGINQMPIGLHMMNLSGIWLSKVLTPGKDLPANSLWQVVEAELMTPDDYDTIAAKGWDAFYQAFMPRIVDMDEWKRHWDWVFANIGRVPQAFREHGYVVMSPAIATIPFEYLCGGRSMTKFFFDLYRMPDRVQAAMDVMIDGLIHNAIGAAKLSGVPHMWVGGWRSASSMLAPKLWDRFVWPYYYKLVMGLHETGINAILHWDQDWTRDLGRLRELPAKSFILNPDGMTDIRKAKEVLADHAAIMGDVPASLFAAGTPEQVRDYVRDLVHDVGPTGLILCPGCDGPVNTRTENLMAYAAACREYGRVAQPA
ncbi:MAG TPA: uroporphyrinogen decarboxylase family protein, partial [Anaerolineae bacterium]